MFVLPGDGDSAVRPFRQLLNRLVLPSVLLPLFAGGCVWMTGAHNPYTPAGYVGYLTKGAVFGKSRFYGVQRGPTSAGRTWLRSDGRAAHRDVPGPRRRIRSMTVRVELRA